MVLEDLGWELYKKNLPQKIDVLDEQIARVAVENRGSYLLYSPLGELAGIMRGKFMRGKKANSAYPKVGDWVVFEKLAGEKKAVIKSVLPRASQIARKKAGENSEEQIIATNIDIVFIVQGLDNDFNLGRLERYLALALEGNCEPVILLNKSDTVPDAQEKFEQTRQAFPKIKVFLTSATQGFGIDQLQQLIAKGISLVFVGSSGTGKSTLINKLLGTHRQKTGAIRMDDGKGKHTTTKRELIVIETGGVLIDTPGMRELGVLAQADAVAEVFADINALVGKCKFNDCNHANCKGCAIIEAVSRGEVSQKSYQRFLKIAQEADAHQKNTWK